MNKYEVRFMGKDMEIEADCYEVNDDITTFYTEEPNPKKGIMQPKMVYNKIAQFFERPFSIIKIK